METLNVDLCVIGAGSGGLSVAAGASQLGQSTVLIEKHKMGGDCLNTGCVPSKALLASAKTAHAARTGAKYGVHAEVTVDYAQAMEHVQSAIRHIEPMDSVERYEGFGATVLQGTAKFIDQNTVEVNDTRITARYFVVATGSSAFVPPISGLEEVRYFTNDTIWNNRVLPDHLIVIGAGPIGLEMAQAHARLGAKVTVLEAMRAMPKDDPEAAAVVLSALRAEGIEIIEGAKVSQAAQAGDQISLTYDMEGQTQTVTGSHLLVAAGRRPVVNGLGLEDANIAFSPRGIEVDVGLRTSNPKVFAVGDVTGGYQFTHVAGYHAGIVIQRALFKMPAKVSTNAIPWVTYTDPELAHVGHTEESARTALGGDIKITRWALAENDRAAADDHLDGFVKVILDRKSRIVGATIVGHMAGELIQPWILAVSNNMKISAFTKMIAPYPTYGEINKRAAGAHYTPKLFSDKTRKIIKLLAKIFG